MVKCENVEVRKICEYIIGKEYILKIFFLFVLCINLEMG